MFKTRKILFFVLALVIIAIGFWYLFPIFIYIISSIMLSFIGSPLVRLLKRIKIGTLNMPGYLAAIIAIIVIVLFFATVISFIIPVIVSQAKIFAEIDILSITRNIESNLLPLENWLIRYKVISNEQKIITILIDNFFGFLKVINVSAFINYILSVFGSVLIGIFAILFITFFLLKDEHLVYNAILLITPEKYHHEMQNILSTSKKLLSRYFIGLLIDLTLIISFYTLGLSIFSIKNAILIAFVAGMLHVIPYLGPLIGGTLGVLIGISSALAFNPYANIFEVVIIIVGVIAVVNIIDNILFQPMIFSNSVKAHPLEIFFVILIGEAFAGILGMILAIPVYTLFRIVAKEFLYRFRIIQKITEKLP